MNDKQIDALGLIVTKCAMGAAADYITSRNLRGAIDLDAVVGAIKRRVQAALPGALDDAKEALSTGMQQAAIVTLGLSMAQAGIDAVKDVKELGQ